MSESVTIQPRQPKEKTKSSVQKLPVRSVSQTTFNNKTLSSPKTARKIKVTEESPSTPRVQKSATSRTQFDHSPSVVGFRPSIRAQSDLIHSRNIISSRQPPVQALSCLHTLEGFLSHIPFGDYEKSDPTKKLDILNKLVEAYNFAWNEATLQLKDISEEHATVFAKMKAFYLNLLNQYPNLLMEFDNQVKELKKTIEIKDHEIHVLNQQINMNEEKNENARNLIAGFKERLNHVIARKHFFKEELNLQVLEVEEMKTTITELRCQVAKQQEEAEMQEKYTNLVEQSLSNNNFMPVIEQIKPETKDVEVNTDPLPDIVKTVYVAQEVKITNPLPNTKGLSLSTYQEPSEAVFNIEDNVTDSHSALRHIVFGFMKQPCQHVESKIKTDSKAELKKFYWVYPKVVVIFQNGLTYEDVLRPYQSFEDVVIGYIKQFYHTSYLTQKMTQSIIQSTQILEQLDESFPIFNSFVRGDYDLSQFRFFNSLFEYSRCYSSPDISNLVNNDSLSPDETKLTISHDAACEVYHAIFPFHDIDEKILNIDGRMSFWAFMSICVEKFDECRKHLWTIVRNSFLLCDCSDTGHISQSHFRSFLGLLFPNVDNEKANHYWNELSIRNKAMEKRSDMLGTESINYFITQNEELFFTIMRIKTIKTFSQIYFDYNASMLDAVSFIVYRLIKYIPNIAKQLPKQAALFKETEDKIREALFQAHVSEAFGFYQMMLHMVDGIFVQDFTRIHISNQSTLEEVQKMLQHFKEREVVSGIHILKH